MTGFDPERDLRIERLMKAAPKAIWRCWEEPDLLRRWFTPPPVEVVELHHDLRPGGQACVVMKLPDGTLMPNDGSFLLVERHRRLVFTDALLAGFRPSGAGFMTADTRLEPKDGGTLYSAHVMHATPEARAEHEQMGFHDGWGTTFEQLDALAASL